MAALGLFSLMYHWVLATGGLWGAVIDSYLELPKRVENL